MGCERGGNLLLERVIKRYFHHAFLVRGDMAIDSALGEVIFVYVTYRDTHIQTGAGDDKDCE